VLLADRAVTGREVMAGWPRTPASRSSAGTARDRTRTEPGPGHRARSRSPTGSTCGKTSPRPSRSAPPPTAPAWPSRRLRQTRKNRTRPCRNRKPAGSLTPPGSTPSAPDGTTNWSTRCALKGAACARSPATWAGACTPSSDSTAPRPGRNSPTAAGRDRAPASSTRSSPTSTSTPTAPAAASPGCSGRSPRSATTAATASSATTSAGTASPGSRCRRPRPPSVTSRTGSAADRTP
jgi:hypothetical protein